MPTTLQKTLERNGSIARWTAKNGETILAPVMINEAGKERGGAPVCCPWFGSVPAAAKHYAALVGEDLPKHGLIKNELGNPTIHEDFDYGTGEQLFLYEYEWPWRHRAIVEARIEDFDTLYHSITVQRSVNNKGGMPVSLGFHPYFATAGQAFTVHFGRGYSAPLFRSDFHDFTCPRKVQADNGRAILQRADGVQIVIELKSGYTHYCLWSDDTSQYVCIEPIRGGFDEYELLKPGDYLQCSCEVRYRKNS